jgi:hypothetical protein
VCGDLRRDDGLVQQGIEQGDRPRVVTGGGPLEDLAQPSAQASKHLDITQGRVLLPAPALADERKQLGDAGEHVGPWGIRIHRVDQVHGEPGVVH